MSANTPEQVHTLFAQYFSAGDLDGLMSLYEPGATFITRTGPPANDTAEIRAALASVVGGEMELQVRHVSRATDLALLISDWAIYAKSTASRIPKFTGRTADVVRQQADGSWLLVIDNSHGGESGG